MCFFCGKGCIKVADTREILFTALVCRRFNLRVDPINQQFILDINKAYQEWFSNNHEIFGWFEVESSMENFISDNFIFIN